jgi:ribosomal subunit interface protein
MGDLLYNILAMNIKIKATKLVISPPLREYVEGKVRRLSKLVKRWDASGALVINVEVARTTRHHRKGKVYYAEANLKLPGTMLRASEEHWDIRAAIVKMLLKLKKEIERYKQKTISRKQQ